MSRERIRAALRRDEGTGPVKQGRFYPYQDTMGKWTIGYGRNLTDRGLSITTVEQMLDEDIDSAIKDCVQAFPWIAALDGPRQGVLVNMAFNLGITKLKKFPRTLALIQAGEYEHAAIAMLQSKWADQVGNRALRLAEQMRTGTWVE